MEAAEKGCLSLYGVEASGATYTMDHAQRAAEAEGLRVSLIDAVEADRIAHSRGWDMALDIRPELKAFAEEQGLYPFPASDPGPPPGPTP